MDEEYCITPEYPYCPVCPFGMVIYPEDFEPGIDTDCEWRCLCTKEDYEKYMTEHAGDEEGEWR